MKCTILVLSCLTALGLALEVKQCADGNTTYPKSVTISNCTAIPCKLRRNSQHSVTVEFSANEHYRNLKLAPTANLAGIDTPYIGIFGTSACDKIFKEDGITKTHCPLEKGKTYVYKDLMDVLQIFPKINTVVHWAIADSDSGKDVMCFEAPISIV